MKLTTLQALWASTHPDCLLDKHLTRKGHYNVQYIPSGKMYTYRSTSVFALAERFELIPRVDIQQTADIVFNAFAAGEAQVIEHAGAGDTVTHLAHENGLVGYVTCENAGLDEYDRPLSCYTWAEVNPWL